MNGTGWSDLCASRSSDTEITRQEGHMRLNGQRLAPAWVVQDVGASDYTDGRVIVKTGLRQGESFERERRTLPQNPHAHPLYAL